MRIPADVDSKDDPGGPATETTPLPSASDDPRAPAPRHDDPSASDPDDHPPAKPHGLERGMVVGRHIVVDRIGTGGMGVVYVAYDPELDRKIALKLLRPGSGSDRARARLLREAQALAKLSHPNVIAIHDVGTLGSQVWLAMELARGQTLRAWLGTPRMWREVLAVLRSAGEGLAAAHAAGLLHRDFKPDNVMVDDDGRVRVMDFGLARARRGKESLEAEPSQPSSSQPSSSEWGSESGRLALPITQAGILVGTPRYMAPEQFQAGEVTTAADQFAFCVTLWVALFGDHPFAGETVTELVANLLAGRRRRPTKGRAVPSRLVRACERGLACDPRQRWPSMDALLEELRRVDAPRGRTWGSVVLAGGLVATGLGVAQYAAASRRCDGAAARLEGVWDSARRAEVREAILGTSLSYAPDTWARVEARLDEYAAQWIAKHTEACEATSVRQEQSAEAMDLRMECLAVRRVALRETVGVLAEADPTRVEKAVTLVAGLPGLGRCDDVESLRARVPPPEDPEVTAEVEAQRERLSQARALSKVGAHAPALAEVEDVLVRAEGLAYPPLLAEALLARSNLHREQAQYPAAEEDAEQAYLLAVEHRHEEIERSALGQLVWLVGVAQGRHEQGHLWGKTALAKARVRRDEPEVEAVVLNNLGAVLAEDGELEQARSHFERALAIREQELGPDDPSVAGSLHNLGLLLQRQGEIDEALACYRRALEIFERALGPRHPEVAYSIHAIGRALAAQGKYDEALDHQRRALALWQESLGSLHPEVASALDEMGIALRGQGKREEALTAYRQALAIREEVLGSESSWVAASFNNIGGVLADQGKLDEAAAHYERALAIWERALGSDHPNVGTLLHNMANLSTDRRRWDEALARHRRAQQIFETAVGLQHPNVASCLNGIGVVLERQGKLDEALTHYQRALEIREQAQGPAHPDVAVSLHNLGFVRWQQGRLDEAEALYRRSLSIDEGALGPEHPDVADALVGLAEIALARGDAEAAREQAERALAIRSSNETVAAALAQARFLLARALWADPSQRERARTLAVAARDVLVPLGEAEADAQAKVRAWLAEHGG